MNISLNNGVLTINSKKVQSVVFNDNTTMQFPSKNLNNIHLNKGVFYINDKEVSSVTFIDNTLTRFPIEDNNIIRLNTSNSDSNIKIEGNGNITISGGKNIISGNINCGGDFHLGDK